MRKMKRWKWRKSIMQISPLTSIHTGMSFTNAGGNTEKPRTHTNEHVHTATDVKQRMSSCDLHTQYNNSVLTRTWQQRRNNDRKDQWSRTKLAYQIQPTAANTRLNSKPHTFSELAYQSNENQNVILQKPYATARNKAKQKWRPSRRQKIKKRRETLNNQKSEPTLRQLWRSRTGK